MGERIKIIGSFALLGFILGVAANIAYYTVVPVLVKMFPELLKAEWILSGFAGAIMTVLLVVLWVYVSRPTR